jgi:protein ImuB
MAAPSRMADLFATLPVPSSKPVPCSKEVSSAPVLATVPAREAAPNARSASVATPGAAAPATKLRKQLWYAVVFPELPAAEAAATLQRLCLHAQTFTSFVSVELPNALLLEIRGSVKLFGSLQKLHADIDACWRRLELPARSATTPSTLGSLWLARAGNAMHGDDAGLLPAQLSKVPLACTAWEGETLQTLNAMGVTKVGELLRLPRAGLARRLGSALVQALDIAVGSQPAPRRAFVPKERFRARSDFETEVEHAAYLEKALEPLIERCARFLRGRQAGVQRLRLRLRHREGPATEVTLGLASITSEARRLMDVAVQKLTRLEIKAPVRGIELISGTLRALSAASLDAFSGMTGAAASGRDTAPELVERLRARLGDEAVYGFCLIPEHRPEAAWRRVSELRAETSEQTIAAEMPRPVWLLQEPLPLSKPDILQGPERIESGWWDGKGVARDYYIARRQHGAKLWVFQERHSKRWYLHGVFA